MSDEKKPDDENIKPFYIHFGKTRKEPKYSHAPSKNTTDDKNDASDIPPEKNNTVPPIPNRNPYQQAANKSDDDDIFSRLGITKAEFDTLIEFRANYEARNNVFVFLVGVLLTPISLAGSLLGYVRAYRRFFDGRSVRAYLWPMRPITRLAMILGAIVFWLLMLALFIVAIPVFAAGNYTKGLILGYLVINTTITLIVFGIFKLWQRRINSAIAEGNKFGSARFAHNDELYTLRNDTGFYIGNGHLFDDKGHILTVAGTRGGKGTNIIIPNLLGAGKVQTSWVIIDPKAENTYITQKYQRSIGQQVIILNPWDLFGSDLGETQTYNPLDILKLDSPHLVDDVQVIAEMIVPIEAGSGDKFWTDSARTIVSGLLLHLVTSQPKDNQTLTTLWEWVRLVSDDWDKLIQDMGVCDVPVNGIIVKNAAHEILKLQSAGDDTFGGIIANVLQATDFLKSPALQQSLKSGFKPETLADGKTTLYVIIPADKLRSHGRYLRLIVTSMMRAVIRQPKNRVTFLLDEFAALGYLPEIETALSTYAGYNVTVWPILQSLIQLKNLYKDNWETFIANCTIRQYFTINDNFSADYISKAIGETSHTIVKKGNNGDEPETNKRALVTPDELRRESSKRIFMFINNLPPTYVDKLPYYEVTEWDDRADKNPYI
ncbi:type IV secretory system conjugative DNA transfer family protein [Mucilaginibacter paludis]|uniref:TRAG family protein n=1 Tax=Mucilaginibacter paludis DSM 18603 TaxID=714943 RepID=H1Y5M6_9SPHI|nr:type IV secretory system conjugative DNA transfer family protein [Mucilaginibacter paludis]EHQ29802.1 TRAG family protein [Mucilaginibacter paludis DSM 18603]